MDKMLFLFEILKNSHFVELNDICECILNTDHLRTFHNLRNTNLSIECSVLLLWCNTVTPDILYK